MKSLLSIALFAGVVLGLSAPASAVIIIDDFGQTSQSISAPDGVNEFDEDEAALAAGEGVGATRYLRVERDSGTNTGTVSIDVNSPDPQGDYQAVATATGDFQVGYDGTVDGSFSPVDAGGLNLDLTGNNALTLLASSDSGIDLLITLYNGATAFTSTISIASGGGPFQEYAALFSSFGAVDLTNVDAIHIESKDAPNTFGRDVSFKLLTAKTVPEPASMILLAIGGVGCAGGAWRRRKRRLAS